MNPVHDLHEQILLHGIPLIENEYLIWGQPLSLSFEFYDALEFPNSMSGDETLEPDDICNEILNFRFWENQHLGRSWYHIF